MRFYFVCLLAIFAFRSYCQQRYSLPLNSLKLTSPFGQRVHPILKRKDFHRGIDLSARTEPVLSVLSGQVVSSGYHPVLGSYVRVSHGEIVTIYGHLSIICVEKGQLLFAGQLIGVTGSTGRSTGEHLHFAVSIGGIYVDPMLFLLGLSH